MLSYKALVGRSNLFQIKESTLRINSSLFDHRVASRSGSNEKKFDNDKRGQRKKIYSPDQAIKEVSSHDYLFGIHPVKNAITAGKRQCFTLFVKSNTPTHKDINHEEKSGVEELIVLAKEKGLAIRRVEHNILNNLSKQNVHQGAVLEASQLQFKELEKLNAVEAAEKEVPLWIALDQITDPVNLGSIVRTSTFFGANGVVTCLKSSPPLSPATSKASAGTLEYVDVHRAHNLQHFLRESKANGWRVIGAASKRSAVELKSLQLDVPTILVLGSEGKGIRPVVQKECEFFVRISGRTSPLGVDSLNVNVATGALLQQLLGK